MDPALARQREAFKKRAIAVPVVEKRSDMKVSSAVKVPSKLRKKAKVHKHKARRVAKGSIIITSAPYFVALCYICLSLSNL